MKFRICVFRVAVVALMMFALFSCSKKKNGVTGKSSTGGRFSVVTTIFPAYDWVMEVIGSRSGDFDVLLLSDKGVDLHSYQPSADDMIRISECDLVVYVGGESDGWIGDALKQRANDKMAIVCMMDLLGSDVMTHEDVERLEADHDWNGHDEDEEDGMPDEHVWLSVKNAEKTVVAISDALCAVDPENSKEYMGNADKYIARLLELDAHCGAVAKMAERRVLLFADRFPFGYFTRDYGLLHYSAFSGCSTDNEASFPVILRLSEKLKETGLPVIIGLDGRSHNMPESVLSMAAVKDVRVLSVDSIESMGSKSRSAGNSYLSVMERNLDVFRQALN